MFFANHPKEKSFFSVAMGLIVFGAVIIALGASEWALNCGLGYHFVYPMGKILAGTVITALGYIVLELELMRKNK